VRLRGVTISLLVLLLLAGTAEKAWSEKHQVGITVPANWTLKASEKDKQVFLIEGPKLGGAVPRAVLTALGPVPVPLADIADAQKKRLQSRPGWSIVATVRKELDGIPCIRLGAKIRVEEQNSRGRVTFIRLGEHVFAFEMSADRSHFPAIAFDRMELSLHTKTRKVKAPGDLELTLPTGWKEQTITFGQDAEPALSLDGPLGVKAFFILGNGEPTAPEAKPGPALRFLKKKAATTMQERDVGETRIRLAEAKSAGYSIAVTMPVDLWDDMFPVFARIVSQARKIKPDEPAKSTEQK